MGGGISRYQITDMTEAHVEQVHAIFQECFTAECWSIRSIREELTNPMAATLVALDGDRVAAFLNVRHVLDEGDINDIAVTASDRGQGLGTLLMERLFEAAPQRGIRSYMLEVRRSNLAAIAFYEKLGFEQVGMRKNYYSNPVEDGFLYRWEL